MSVAVFGRAPSNLMSSSLNFPNKTRTYSLHYATSTRLMVFYEVLEIHARKHSEGLTLPQIEKLILYVFGCWREVLEGGTEIG